MTFCTEAGDGNRYLLRNAIAFSKPLQGIKGQQSVFWGATTPERVKAFAEAWMILQSRLK
jgi:hypothetical protein